MCFHLGFAVVLAFLGFDSGQTSIELLCEPVILRHRAETVCVHLGFALVLVLLWFGNCQIIFEFFMVCLILCANRLDRVTSARPSIKGQRVARHKSL